MEYPLWATPERRAFLAKLQELRCTLGDDPCPVIERFSQAVRDRLGEPGGLDWVFRAALITPTILAQLPIADRYHIPSWLAKVLIEGWKEDDRIERSILWQKEKRQLHALPRIWKRGPFDTIAREEYLAKRPIWRIVGIGVNAFTQQRVALVEIPDLIKQTIWVNLSGLKIEGSKNKLRKLARYKRGSLPKGLVEKAEARVNDQVQKFLS